ncbi:MAG: CapA family protein [Actinomycetota bacterium]
MRGPVVMIVATALVAAAVAAIPPVLGAQPPTCFGQAATIVAAPGERTVGTDGRDVIVGTSGPDDIRAGGGDDLVCGLGGPDVIRGNAGDDMIAGGGGRDQLFGGKGRDTINGGKGRDEIHGNSAGDTLNGNSGQDEIWGGTGPDVIHGGTAHDRLRGQKGDDALIGGSGPDLCGGGPGADTKAECEATTTLAFSGEILSHGAVIDRAARNARGDLDHDYRPMFDQVRPLLESADLAICHLETPVSETNVGLAGYPVFNAPRDLPAALVDVGYDGCSTASNHSMDKGTAGVRATLRVMDEAGLPQTGMARSQRLRDRPRLYELGDLTIGHLSYTYGLNGFRLPSDELYLVNVTTVDEVLADAEAAKDAGADLVVLSIQWGNEYQVDPSASQVRQAKRFLTSGLVDAIVGAHVHVVQPVDEIDHKFVFYGVGNFLSNQSAACCPAASQNGLIAYLDVVGSEETGWAVGAVSFVPTRVDRSDYTIVPLPQALDAGGLSPSTRSLYRRVIAETDEVVTRLGLDVPVRDDR